MIATIRLSLSRCIEEARSKAGRWSPASRALLWMSASGFLYCLLNSCLRAMSLRMNPYQTLTMVYVATLVVMLPFIRKVNGGTIQPNNLKGLVVRGGVHWLGMCLWMLAVTHITLAETTAIGFTTPLFILIGAALLLNEKFRWERGVATLAGFAGVLIVVAPRFTDPSGSFALVMLGASAVFAGSFLLSKRLTQMEAPWVIVLWQSLVVTVFSLPLAILNWQSASWPVWLTALVAAVFTVIGNYCLTKAFTVADISASQPAKFLDLVWASLLGWIYFADRIEQSTIIGGTIILVATIWIARREASR